MRIDLGDVSLWFDVSGPSAIPRGDAVVERPTLVAVHGGPGSDHINLKAVLAPRRAARRDPAAGRPRPRLMSSAVT